MARMSAPCRCAFGPQGHDREAEPQQGENEAGYRQQDFDFVLRMADVERRFHHGQAAAAAPRFPEGPRIRYQNGVTVAA
jgi:hypothetical protein